jgi:hypothetical protein
MSSKKAGIIIRKMKKGVLAGGGCMPPEKRSRDNLSPKDSFGPEP